MHILPLFFFLLYYSLGFWLLFRWRKKQIEPQQFFYQGTWLLIAIIGYTSVLEALNGSFFFAIPLFFFALFFFSYRRQKARTLNGFLFNLFIVVYGAYLIYATMTTRDLLIAGLFFFAFVVVILAATLGIIGLIIFLYWNAFIVMKRESRSIANLLTLLLAIALTIYVVITFFVTQNSAWYIALPVTLLTLTLGYLFLVFVNFLTISILYQFNQPRKRQDFIIVLGAGLINGERVTPLLARRIDKAILFYREQKIKTGHPLKFIMSGGQGPDEKVSEAVAMQQYALEQGIPHEDILLEANSTTTYENMMFSKSIIDAQGLKQAKVIFASNNYHIFRAAIFAKEANLDADGIGAKTAFYYLPNAFLREFAAMLKMKKHRHALILGILFVLITAVSLFNVILS